MKKLIIFTDSGDTFIDEGSQIQDEQGTVTYAEMIPTGKETLMKLYEEGYLIAMVADGTVQSFKNVYEAHQLGHCFHTRTISAAIGAEKPDQLMFEDAMKQNGLTGKDKHRIVMIGNNLKRDIKGANQFGITSILLDWSPRYDMNPASEDEQPDYIVHEPKELIPLLEQLDKAL